MRLFKRYFLFLSIFAFFSAFLSTLPAKGPEAISTKAIVFDCDGTLVDNGNSYFLAWQHALRCQGYELSEKEFWGYVKKHHLIGNPSADSLGIKYCCELLGRDASAALARDKATFSATLHEKGFPPIKATVDFLRRLSAQKERLGLKIGLASAASRAHIMRNLKHLNIEDCFDIIISGSDDLKHYNDPEGTNKPKPYIYLHTAQELGIDPHHCVAIEDSQVGVLSAIRAGFVTIAVPNEQTKNHDLSPADLKIDTFHDISVTDFLQMVAEHHTKKASPVKTASKK